MLLWWNKVLLVAFASQLKWGEERAWNFSYGYFPLHNISTSKLFTKINLRSLKQTKLLPDQKKFVRVFQGETIGEVSIIKERGAKKHYILLWFSRKLGGVRRRKTHTLITRARCRRKVKVALWILLIYVGGLGTNKQPQAGSRGRFQSKRYYDIYIYTAEAS